MEKTVCELFAGVGGFRLGLELASLDFKIVWFSQWEPIRKHQFAHECYVSHFGDIREDTKIDINLVDKETISNFNILVGGFPCQDYSVATTKAQGIEGSKNLWWSICDVLDAKNPPFVLLENVDRLLKSPTSQRGRDFLIMLSCLHERNYNAEWRIVNAADYGAGQKRKRVFIFAFKNTTKWNNTYHPSWNFENFHDFGFMAKAFPITDRIQQMAKITMPMKGTEASFSYKFLNSGILLDNEVIMAETIPQKEEFVPLGSLLENKPDKKYFLTDKQIKEFQYLKGPKRINRISKTGYSYIFSEGQCPFPDKLDSPARTMLTSEGTVNRSSHVVQDDGRLRFITPLEAERIQGFPDNWTLGMPEKGRYFCMGNALVVPMVQRMGKVLSDILDKE